VLHAPSWSLLGICKTQVYNCILLMLTSCCSVGYDGVMGLMPYNRTFRMHRKLTATQVSSKSITRFEPIQELEILRLLKRIYQDQDPNSQNLPDHLNQYVFLTAPEEDAQKAIGYPAPSCSASCTTTKQTPAETTTSSPWLIL
jgi:hypothetical protein